MDSALEQGAVMLKEVVKQRVRKPLPRRLEDGSERVVFPYCCHVTVPKTWMIR